MSQLTTLKEKFATLKSWMPAIIDSIKRDLKNEHLKTDFVFIKKYLNNKSPQKLGVEGLAHGYSQAIAEDEKGEQIAEFMVNRWLLKHADIYHLFEKELSAINPNFDSIESLKPEQARPLIEKSVEAYGARDTFLFAALNSVALQPAEYKFLKERAEKEVEQQVVTQIKQNEKKSMEDLEKRHALEMNRVIDRYEKKVAGLESKYNRDTEALKKQIAILQRKFPS